MTKSGSPAAARTRQGSLTRKFFDITWQIAWHRITCAISCGAMTLQYTWSLNHMLHNMNISQIVLCSIILVFFVFFQSESQRVPKLLFCEMNLKIIIVEILSHLLGAKNVMQPVHMLASSLEIHDIMIMSRNIVVLLTWMCCIYIYTFMYIYVCVCFAFIFH